MTRHPGSVCCSAALASALMCQPDPAGAFEADQPPQLQYERYHPFGDSLGSCTDKLYEQDSDGRYIFKGISYSPAAVVRAADEKLIIEEVSVFGAMMIPRQEVSYYRIEEKDGVITILEWSKRFAGKQPVNHLRIAKQRLGEPSVTDLLPEDNYRTLLSTINGEKRFEMIGQINKLYDKIRLTALVSYNQVLSRFDKLEPVRVRLSVDISDMQSALKQMVEMSYAGIEMAEALGKGRQRVRQCN